MRVYWKQNKPLYLSTPTGDVTVPPGVWFPLEGDPEFPEDATAKWGQLQGLVTSGQLDIRRGTTAAKLPPARPPAPLPVTPEKDEE